MITSTPQPQRLHKSFRVKNEAEQKSHLIANGLSTLDSSTAETNVPDWVYCRVSSLKALSMTSPIRKRKPNYFTEDLRTSPTSTESSDGVSVCLPLRHLGQQLSNVTCNSDCNRLVLTGSVGRYYELQLAIEAARRMAHGRQIEVKVEVIRPMNPIASDVDGQAILAANSIGNEQQFKPVDLAFQAGLTS